MGGRRLGASLGNTVRGFLLGFFQEFLESLSEGLYFGDNPFFDNEHIEKAISLGDIIATEYGPKNETGRREMRVLVLKQDNLFNNVRVNSGFLPRYNIFDPVEKQRYEGLKAAVEECSGVMMIQRWSEEKQQYEPVPLPHSIGVIGEIGRVMNFVEQYYEFNTSGLNEKPGPLDPRIVKVMGFFFSGGRGEEVELPEIKQYIDDNFGGWGTVKKGEEQLPFKDWLFEKIKAVRALNIDLPENLPWEVYAALTKTMFFPHQGDTLKTLEHFGNNAGWLRCAVFVPKGKGPVFQEHKRALKAWGERFVSFETPPEVYLVKTRGGIFGLGEDDLRPVDKWKIYVRHPKGDGSFDEPNSITDNDGLYTIVPNEQIPAWIKEGRFEQLDANGPEAQEAAKFFKIGGFKHGRLIEMWRVKPDRLELAVLPNEALGQNRMRVAWCLPCTLYREGDDLKEKPESGLLLLSNLFRDKYFSERFQRTDSNTWITLLSEEAKERIKKLMSWGIFNVDKWGLLSPYESLLLMMKGFEERNGSVGIHSSMIPSSPSLRESLLDWLYYILLTDQYPENANIAVALENIQVLKINGRNVANWLKAIGKASETITGEQLPLTVSNFNAIPALEPDGSLVILKMGEAIPFNSNFMFISQVGGEEYLIIGVPVRGNKGQFPEENIGEGFGEWVKRLIRGGSSDELLYALAIPMKEAYKSLVSLDPDPNLWEATKAAAVVTTVVLAVAFPQGAAVVAATPGLALRKGIMIFADWSMTAGAEMIEAMMKIVLRGP